MASKTVSGREKQDGGEGPKPAIPGLIETSRTIISVGKTRLGDEDVIPWITGSQVTRKQGFKPGDRVRLTVSREVDGRPVSGTAEVTVEEKKLGPDPGAYKYLEVPGIPAEKLPELKLKHGDAVGLRIEKISK